MHTNKFYSQGLDFIPTIVWTGAITNGTSTTLTID
jgi:hypothetical protein